MIDQPQSRRSSVYVSRPCAIVRDLGDSSAPFGKCWKIGKPLEKRKREKVTINAGPIVYSGYYRVERVERRRGNVAPYTATSREEQVPQLFQQVQRTGRIDAPLLELLQPGRPCQKGCITIRGVARIPFYAATVEPAGQDACARLFIWYSHR